MFAYPRANECRKTTSSDPIQEEAEPDIDYASYVLSQCACCTLACDIRIRDTASWDIGIPPVALYGSDRRRLDRIMVDGLLVPCFRTSRLFRESLSGERPHETAQVTRHRRACVYGAYRDRIGVRGYCGRAVEQIVYGYIRDHQSIFSHGTVISRGSALDTGIGALPVSVQTREVHP